MSTAIPAPIVFLDKDGTLVTNIPYNVEPERITLVAGAEDALVMLRNAGFDVAVVSNQPGVAFGHFSESALDAVQHRIAELLGPLGVRFRGLYYCPHHPHGSVSRYAVECNCRKPRCGLLMRARFELDVDLSRSWMVGDILDDVEAGERAGCRTILVDSGGETQWLGGPFRHPDLVVSNLAAAARAIVTWPPAGGWSVAAAPNVRSA